MPNYMGENLSSQRDINDKIFYTTYREQDLYVENYQIVPGHIALSFKESIEIAPKTIQC